MDKTIHIKAQAAGPVNGGNLILRAGIGSTAPLIDGSIMRDGSIVFERGNGMEVLRFDPSGEVYVRGELVDSNKEIYDEFRLWLHEIGVARFMSE